LEMYFSGIQKFGIFVFVVSNRDLQEGFMEMGQS